MNASSYLLEKYGAAMTAAQVGEVLHRNIRAVWEAASNSNDPISAAKRKIGRRVYFSTSEIASLLDKPVPSRKSTDNG